MNPLDHLALHDKCIIGVSAPVIGWITAIPGDINPWLQTAALISGIIVSLLSAISIVRKNIK
jgi:hypothetical protein